MSNHTGAGKPAVTRLTAVAASTNHPTMDSSHVPESPAGAKGRRRRRVLTAATPGTAPSKVRGEFNVLCYALLSLFIVSFGAWLIYAWSDYSKHYAPNAEGWYVGGTHSVEVTLVPEDVRNLGCASDVMVAGMHCAHRANQQPFELTATEDRLLLRPYNTVAHVLFLGAGLWSSARLAGLQPKERFTVVCNFHMAASIKSAALRWEPDGSFDPVKEAVPAGLLTDCVMPQ